jgi:glycosyltransferase involved in cell wall biosynthesis
MPAPLLLDLSHTSHTRARTGIQRVARALARELAGDALPVCFDPYERRWRTLDAWETRMLAAEAPARARGAHWPLTARCRGWLRRIRGRPAPLPEAAAAPPAGAPDAAALEIPWGALVPEIFSPAVNAALPALFGAVRGPRVALFNDAIALQLPELSPAGTVARFPGYLRELLAFDGVAAISEDSRATLVDYWRWLGAARTPPVVAIPLGIDLPAATGPLPSSTEPWPAARSGTGGAGALPIVLSVGTLEGRKNHVALLKACEHLWSQGRRFELRLIGLTQAETGRPAAELIASLQAAGRPLLYDGPAGEPALEAAYAACAFTVYPSLAEGFGLPVAESLARGKPCICLGSAALGEIARGGGCIPLAAVTPAELAGAIGRLLDSPAELADLAAAARRRRFRTWADYAAALTAWMREIPRRD